MQFSDTTNSNGLLQDVNFLVGTDATSYPNADKARCINQWYYKVIAWILESDTNWEWDDTNYSNLPRATATLVNAQQDYALPQAAASGSNDTTFLQLLRVEVLDVGSIWHKLEPISDLEIDQALGEFAKTNGLPRWYRVWANSIFLYPAPDNGVSVTLSGGLRVYFQRTMDEFTATDTTQLPGFAANFHRILSLGAAYDYSIAKGLPQANALRNEIEVFKKELQTFYGQKNREQRVRIRPYSVGRRLPI